MADKPLHYVMGAHPVNSPWPWLTMYHISNDWGAKSEFGTEVGIDIADPFDDAQNEGIPITSLTTGPLLGRGYYEGGGVVSVKLPQLPRANPHSLYYQHFDLIHPAIMDMKQGDIVQVGQLLGWSGGQVKGGHHPASKRTSSGPHMEVGRDAPYGGMWNPYNWGPNVDPIPLLREIVNGQLGSAGIFDWTTAPGFLPIAQAWDDSMRFHPFEPLNPIGSGGKNLGPFLSRGIVVMLGLLLVMGVAWQVIAPVADEALSFATRAAGGGGGGAGARGGGEGLGDLEGGLPPLSEVAA